MLYRLKANNTLNQTEKLSLTELIIAKHRNGPTGIVKFKFNETQTQFIEFDL